MGDTNYQGNQTNKPKKRAEKAVAKVVSNEVTVKKKSLGRKIKDLFIEADFRTVARYVVSDVLIPAAQNMIVEASTKGIERMFRVDSTHRRIHGPGPRYSYQSPVQRGYSPLRNAPPVRMGPRGSRNTVDEFIISSRPEAEEVLERMNDILETYEVVSILDFKELLGQPNNPVDNSWGWTFLGTVPIRAFQDGYFLELPPAEPI